VAVIGAALRFPGCRDLAEFWAATLSGGEGCIRDLGDRWDTARFFDPRPATPGRLYTLAGGRVDDLDLFDARYFGITPKEACIMDPQHRMLLELSLAALEDARIDWPALAGSDTGVYVGMGSMDYALLVDDPALCDTRFATGNALSGACGRISYTFGLQGPSVTVDTACSASLTALHLGVQAVRRGECRMALVAGANALLSPIPSVALCSGGLLAADGRARVFDNDAHGLVRAEGGSVIVLKPLQDAIEDGNPVLSVIRGSAMCHDGASSGMTVPNGTSQRKVISRALRNAGVAPPSVGYIEAHGASTRLGDPIELGSLDAEYSGRTDPLYVGSTKAVTGHLEAGAGLAGFLRATLILREGVIPPQANFETPNANFDWDASVLRVATEPERWPVGGRRLAGVSSFGISGTNVHVIVEEPPVATPQAARDEAGPCLLTLSAVDGEQLRHQARVWSEWTPEPGASIGAIAYASNTTRATLPERLCVAGRSLAECRTALESFARGEHPPRAASGRVRTGLRPEVSWWFEDASALTGATARDLAESIQRYAPEHLTLLSELGDPPAEREATAWLDGQLEWDRLGTGRQPAAVWLQMGAALVAARLGVPIQRYAGAGTGRLAAAACAGDIDTVEALQRKDGDGFRSPDRAALLVQPWQALVVVGDSPSDRSDDSLHGKAIPCHGDAGLLLALGALWVEFGLGPKWEVVQGTTVRAGIPRTSLNRERYWVDMLGGSGDDKGLLGAARRSRAHGLDETEFVTRLSVAAWPALADHVVDGIRVFPAVGYIELLLEAMATVMPGAGFVEDLRLLRPLIVPDGGVDLHLTVRKTSDLAWSAELAAPDGDSWTVHATAELHARTGPADPTPVDLEDARTRCARDLDVADGYRWLAENGVALGPGFRMLRSAWAGEAELVGQVEVARPGWLSAPSTVDGCFHILAPLCRERGLEGLHLPESIQRVEVFARPRGPRMWVRAVVDEAGSEPQPVRAGFELFDNDGTLVARITGLVLRRRGTPGRPEPVPILGVDWVPYSWQQDSGRASVDRRAAAPMSIEDLLNGWPADQLVFRPARGDADGVAGVLALCQRVAKFAVQTTRAPQLVFITRSDNAAVSFLRSFTLENLGLRIMLVDEADGADPVLTERLLDQLMGEVGERQFAVRRDGVYVPRLVRRPPEPAEVQLSSDRWYVVAGGTRGVGLEVALSMEGRGARRIAVCGRTATVDDERVEQARARGVDFRVAAVDVADSAAVDAWLAGLRADAPVGGVVHSAGVVKDALVPGIDLSESADVWASKVAGARNLLASLERDDPTFVVFFSSASAVFGSPAQALYAAANGCLEVLAAAAARPVHTIAWGPWDDIGIAAALPAVHRRLLESRGFRFIRRAEGVDAFWRIVGGHPGHTIAARIQCQLLAETYAASGYGAFLERLDPPSREPVPPAAKARVDIDLIEYLTRQVAFVSGSSADQIGPDDDLFDHGLDSLMMLDVIERVNREFHVKVAPDDIFDHATIAELSAHLRKLVTAANGTVNA
jgi:acyl transferase domain-containing protein/acyl carrier protein